MENDYEDFLSHYGVPGMRWGVKKSKSSSKSSGSKRREKNYRKTYNKSVKSQKKTKYEDISTLSDNELRSRINRMQLERQYSSLLKDQAYAVRRGKAKTDNMMKRSIKNVAESEIKKAIRPNRNKDDDKNKSK